MSKIVCFLNFVGKNNRRNIIWSLCLSLIIILLFSSILFTAIVYKEKDGFLLSLSLTAVGLIILSALINLFIWLGIERQREEIEELKEKVASLKDS